MGTKEHEKDCLRQSLAECSLMRGETRRLARRLATTRESDSERPDFTFALPSQQRGVPATLIGLEHFMVDQCCEAQRKREGVNSLGARRRKALEALRNKYAPQIESGHELPDEAVAELLTLIAETMTDMLSSSYPEFMKSFETIFLDHLGKVDEYRKSLRNKANDGEHIELGFLIEVHSDMSHYTVVDSNDRRRCASGDILVFDDMLELFEKASGKIDFVILSVYGNVDTEPKNVLAFRCGNVKKSITKQHVPICSFASIESDLDAFAMPKAEVSVSHTFDEGGEMIDAVYSVGTPTLDAEIMAELMLRGAMRAWFALRNGRAFVSSEAIATFIDVFGDEIVGWRKLGDDASEWRVRPVMQRRSDQRSDAEKTRRARRSSMQMRR